MFARLKIVYKLALVNSVSIAVVFLVIAFAVLAALRTLLQAEFEKRIEQEAELVASTLGAAVLFQDWETVRELASSLLTDESVIRARLVDVDGAAVVAVGAASAGGETFLPIRNAAGVDSQNLFLVTMPVLDGDQSLAELQVVATNIEVTSAVEGAIPPLLVLMLVVLLVGLALTYGLQSYVVQPIEALSSLVKRVREQSDYSLRAVVANPDEVGALTGHVNEMLDLIRARDEDLAKTVAERTSQLQERNRELKQEIEQRRASEDALSESRLRFENAFSNAPIGMALIDAEGTFLQRNRRLDRLLGIDASEAGVLASFLTADSAELVRRELAKLASGEISNVEIEASIVNSGQLELTCVLSASAIVSEGLGFLYSVLQLQDITESTRLSQELAFQATHDALTGLANRRVLESELASVNRELRDGGPTFAFCLMDLDQFKVVNDTCGHSAGDSLLMQVSRLLKATVRPDDLVVRLGGDEFAVLLYGCDEQKGLGIAEAIRHEVESASFLWEGHSFRVGVSIGMVTATTAYRDITEVMRQADTACFAAKDLGRNRIYHVSANDEQLARNEGEMQWVSRINAALEEDDFLLFAQPILPICAANTGESRCEVLLRLRDYAGQRMIAPGAFFSSIERYDLSVRVDRWVINHLVRMLKSYVELFAEDRRFWINLSGQSLGDEKFLEDLEKLIDNSGLPPGMLNFEVTETAVIRNLVQASDAMLRLKAFDCKFALDDFGTGLSSFGYLKSLPVDFIKIDGIFVRNIVDDEVDRMFVKSIIEIARTMGIQTVAEFVEDDQILAVLRGLGVDYGQGYGLGYPSELLPTLPGQLKPGSAAVDSHAGR